MNYYTVENVSHLADGGTNQFFTASMFLQETLLVFLNGILMQEGIDYNIEGDNSYRFHAPPRKNSRIQHIYIPVPKIAEPQTIRKRTIQFAEEDHEE